MLRSAVCLSDAAALPCAFALPRWLSLLSALVEPAVPLAEAAVSSTVEVPLALCAPALPLLDPGSVVLPATPLSALDLVSLFPLAPPRLPPPLPSAAPLS